MKILKKYLKRILILKLQKQSVLLQQMMNFKQYLYKLLIGLRLLYMK
jgi:hypothetical protein